MPSNSTVTGSVGPDTIPIRILPPYAAEPVMSKGAILLVIGDAAEVLDTFYPLFRLKEEGYEVRVGGPEKRVYHLVQHDRHPDWDITVESAGYKLAADVAFREVSVMEYAGMVVNGGRAPEYLRYDADLLRLTQQFFE